MSISKELLLGFPVKIHRPPTDPFFEDGNQVFCFHEKTVNSDIDFLVDSITAVHIDEFNCSVKGCLETFTNPMQYNRHYDMLHKFRCETCSRSFSNNHLLSTHISENHDMFFKAQKEKGIAVYHCLIETCGRTFKAMETRRRHLVEKHKYPSDFRFNAVKRNHQKYQKSKNGSSGQTNNEKLVNAAKEIAESSHQETMCVDEGFSKNPLLDKPEFSYSIEALVVADIDMKKTKKTKPKSRIKANKPSTTNNKNSKGKGKTTSKITTKIEAHRQTNFLDVEMGGDLNEGNDDGQQKTETKKKIPTTICFGRGTPRGFTKTL